MEEGNKLEKLERKVEELERKLQEKTSTEDTVREMEKRLMVYEDKIRSDKGEVILKKNLVLENRRAIDIQSIDGKIDPASDNTFTIYFNNNQANRLNHIFLGTASAKGFYNTSLIAGEAISKDTISDITFEGQQYENPHNGTIRFKVYNEKYFEKGLPVPTSPDGGQPNIVVANRETADGQKGIEGVIAQLTGTGKNPYASIGTFVEDSLIPSTYIACDKDNITIFGIPATDPGVVGAIWRDGTTLKVSLG